MEDKHWIRKAHLKKGTLSRQLGIPEDENIPNLLLEEIKYSKIGTYITFRYKHIKVTRLLKQRAQLAINLKNISR